MRKDPDFSYTNKHGKKVHGAAAFTHEVYTNHGGVRQYNENVGLKFLQGLVKQLSPSVTKSLEKDSHKKHFKVVGK